MQRHQAKQLDCQIRFGLPREIRVGFFWVAGPRSFTKGLLGLASPGVEDRLSMRVRVGIRLDAESSAAALCRLCLAGRWKTKVWQWMSRRATVLTLDTSDSVALPRLLAASPPSMLHLEWTWAYGYGSARGAGG